MDNLKQCTKCKEIKPYSSFTMRFDYPNRPQSVCKTCKNAGSRQKHSVAYTDKRRQQMLANKEQRVVANKTRMREYLSNQQCVDCGIKDIEVLEFDHVIGIKKANVTALYSYSWDTIYKEIAKCVVVCVNCHRLRTAKSFGWYKILELIGDNAASYGVPI